MLSEGGSGAASERLLLSKPAPSEEDVFFRYFAPPAATLCGAALKWQPGATGLLTTPAKNGKAFLDFRAPLGECQK
jgi:hypothetical protein